MDFKKQWLAFLSLNSLLLILHAQHYLFVAGMPATWLGFLSAEFAVLSQFSLISILLWGFCSFGLCLSKRFKVYFAALIFTLAHLFIVIDTRIYALFRFHFNGLILNVLTTPGGWQSMHITTGEIVGGIVGVGLVFLFHMYLFRKLPPITFSHQKLISANLLFLFFFNVSDRILYAYGDALSITYLTYETRRVPFYQPFTIKRFLQKQFQFTAHEHAFKAYGGAVSEKNNLNYPTKPIQATVNKKHNIVWIIADSLRRDAVQQETMPHTYQFMQQSVNFTNHWSGGNNTRMGIFSMFYGLPGSYWNAFLSARRPPVLLETLAQTYEVKVFSSASLTFPEFRQTVFNHPDIDVRDQYPFGRVHERDKALTDDFLQYLSKSSDQKNFFSVLFYDGSHSAYDYPEAEEIFKPSTLVAYYAARHDTETQALIRNRYRNAVYHVDKQIGRVLAALKNQMDHTIVIVTSDHGEEFYEHGFWGHFSAFTPEQIHVPLMVAMPGEKPQLITRRTNHFDLPVTLFNHLGVEADPETYSIGNSLFDGTHQNAYFLSCAWDQCAIIDDEGFYIFGIEPYNIYFNEHRDAAYQLLGVLPQNHPAQAQRVISVLRKMGQFLR